MNLFSILFSFCLEVLKRRSFVGGFFFVFLESFFPFLPLSFFILWNVASFGLFFGVFLSWVATSLGNICFYFFFSFFYKKWFYKSCHFWIKRKISSFPMLTFSQLVLLMTLPFSPSFFITILCVVTEISFDEYFLSVVVGKVFSVVFWGYIGKSVLSSMKDIFSLFYVVLSLIGAYFLSKILSKKMNIE